MTHVQVAHRRHERDALAAEAPAGDEFAQFRDPRDGLHLQEENLGTAGQERQKQCSGAGYVRVLTACV